MASCLGRPNCDFRTALPAVTLGVIALVSRQAFQAGSFVPQLLAGHVGIFAVVLLFYLFFFITKRTIVSALEWLALSRLNPTQHLTAADIAERPPVSVDR